jgi:hypothetical protein
MMNRLVTLKNSIYTINMITMNIFKEPNEEAIHTKHMNGWIKAMDI